MDISGGDEWALVGERIRSAREKSGISMRELARRIAVSPSHVSQVERGNASFSVRALYSVANVLGVSMDSLFSPADEGGQVEGEQAPLTEDTALEKAGTILRSSDRPTITLDGGPRWERLTPNAEQASEFIEVIYAPAGSHTEPPTDFVRHAGREYGIIIKGSLNVLVGFDSTTLHEGDSIALNSSTPHRFWNATDEEVRAVWFILDTHESHSGSGREFTSAAAAHGIGRRSV